MSKFEIIKGSCVDQKVDAIVNAANGNMVHSGGIARVILMKAGPNLNDACKKHKLPVRTGFVITTPAFNIKNAKIIIHAVGPDFGYRPDAFGELCDAYYRSLVELKNNNYHTIAFPLISSGIFGGNLDNPVAISTKYCIKAYNRFVNSNYHYDIDVKLCAYTNEEYKRAIAQQEEMKQKHETETKQGFDSINDIINYLKNEYKKAEYIEPDPSYTIGENEEKIYYIGGMKYDLRVFDIPEFLVKNKYIEEKYYNKDNYPEFFEEDWKKYDFESLDIARVSYLILRIFYIVRMFEGSIDNMISEGYLLKLVERASRIKEDE